MQAFLKLLVNKFEGSHKHPSHIDMFGDVIIVGFELERQEVPKVLLA